jgi:hypothetical protein
MAPPAPCLTVGSPASFSIVCRPATIAASMRTPSGRFLEFLEGALHTGRPVSRRQFRVGRIPYTVILSKEIMNASLLPSEERRLARGGESSCLTVSLRCPDRDRSAAPRPLCLRVVRGARGRGEIQNGTRVSHEDHATQTASKMGVCLSWSGRDRQCAQTQGDRLRRGRGTESRTVAKS